MVNMLVGIIHAEGFLNSSTLCHELNGAARVRRDVTNGHEPEIHRWSDVPVSSRTAFMTLYGAICHFGGQ